MNYEIIIYYLFINNYEIMNLILSLVCWKYFFCCGSSSHLYKLQIQGIEMEFNCHWRGCQIPESLS